MVELIRDNLIEAAKKAVGDSSDSLACPDFERITGISQYHIYRLFREGDWSKLKCLVSINRHPKDNQPLSDDDLLKGST